MTDTTVNTASDVPASGDRSVSPEVIRQIRYSKNRMDEGMRVLRHALDGMKEASDRHFETDDPMQTLLEWQASNRLARLATELVQDCWKDRKRRDGSTLH
jgi:hypothetical protein